MYRVLLADDEPIILSGLQSMLEWEKMNCTIAGTARNGKQALDFIQEQRPDIVICDINMPTLTGLELLSLAAERFPEVVFIMLTNHEKFDMALESMRHRAVDYLLKIDLDEDKLAQSMARAMTERDKRRKAARAEQKERGPEQVPSDIIIRDVNALLVGGEREVDEAVSGLEARGATNGCIVAEVVMDGSHIPNISAFTAEERTRLFDFHRKLAEDLAQKLFFEANYVMTARREDRLLLFFWNQESNKLAGRFQTKLAGALGNISQMQVSVLCTDLLTGQAVREARRQLLHLESEYEISPKPVICYSQAMSKNDYVDAATRYVDSHIMERVSVQDVAAAIGITPNYLSSLFKRQLGQNFMDYVNMKKIKQACRMLEDNRHLVYEVSHMLGYDNAYYFSKVFKRYMGVTPTEYQQHISS